ncbi:BQ2448_2037 [Microbotryum intermedium]|uniref:BQ2448_2037 protein n=1 Tax=Microbotryum intermedium TaxID=269621 RepID=A0A238F788_9BASI|nr:BQ2448_2037 [Microbotryum intermedium]
MHNVKSKLPELNSDNYDKWCKFMQLNLELRGLWNITKFGDETLPRDERLLAPAPKHRREIETQDIKAQLLLLSHMDDASLDRVMDCNTAQAIWEKLKEFHRPSDDDGDYDDDLPTS